MRDKKEIIGVIEILVGIIGLILILPLGNFLDLELLH